jgi:hypothetical protein
MELEPFTGPGSTPARRRFWRTVRDAVLSGQKVAGRFVTTDEHPGLGTVINVDDTSIRRGGGGGGPPVTPTGACCVDGECSIVTETECDESGGNYLGDDTTCEGVDCTQGACCDGSDCSITTPDECTGIYQGDGTTCDPNPCEMPPCCENAFEHDGSFFLTKTVCWEGTGTGNAPCCNGNGNACSIITIDPDTCETTVVCAGTGHTDDCSDFNIERSWVLYPGDHCGWDFDGVPGGVQAPIGACVDCSLDPCATTGFLEDETEDCHTSCHSDDSDGDNSVTITYSNECFFP